MDGWWVFLLIGFTAGVVGAMLGVGGGIILVPALVLAMGLAQKSAQGMSLATMTVITLVAALRYWANPEVRMNWHGVALLAVAGAVGAVVGARIARFAPVDVLQKIFAVVLVVAAVKLAFFTKSPPRHDSPDAPTVEEIAP